MHDYNPVKLFLNKAFDIRSVNRSLALLSKLPYMRPADRIITTSKPLPSLSEVTFVAGKTCNFQGEPLQSRGNPINKLLVISLDAYHTWNDLRDID